MGEGSRLGGRMDTRRVEELLSAGAVPQELTPMLEHCLTALRAGTEEAALLDGGAEHALLRYFLDQPVPGIIITR